MILRRWVVYRMDALPPPRDLVHLAGRRWTLRGANRLRRKLGPNVREWAGEPCYFMVARRPLCRRRRRTT